MQPTPRRAARLLVVDPNSGTVLLFQYEDDGRRWWATPGGGLEADETFEVRLSNATYGGASDPSRVVIGDGLGLGTIVNNDTAALSVSFAEFKARLERTVAAAGAECAEGCQDQDQCQNRHLENREPAV